MPTEIEIRPLLKEDDRSRFSCGQPDLDRFFEHYAGQNQFKLGLAVTYVAIRGGEIFGYATVAAGSIERDSLPTKRLRKAAARVIAHDGGNAPRLVMARGPA